MAINYTWSITQCEHIVATGFITVAHWTCNAQDGDYTASVYSTCSFADADPQVPYAEVTEAEVLDWCWSNGVDKAATEASLASQIELLKNPVQESGLPWAQ